MLTGDREEVAKRVADELSIEYRAKMLPEDKAKAIDEFHSENKVVIMVGDGINDILALSKADISIAMKSGADVAIDVSDIVLLNNSLESLRDSILISKRVYFFIKENLALSLIYNMITIPLAIAGFIIPLFASISMSVSSILVILNSIRIKNYKG
jgi:Cu+-exporting ATPase